MHISALKVENLSNGPKTGDCSAVLVIHSGDNRIHLHVRTPVSDDAKTVEIVDALINDGLRQLRRMPGYRRGEREIQVTPETTIICEGCP